MKILIAEREDNLRKKMVLKLNQLEEVSKVFSAESCAMVLKILFKEKIDILITDLKLKDGYSISFLRKVSVKKGIKKIIAYTNMSFLTEELDQIIEVENFIDVFLIKELGLDWFAEFLARHLPEWKYTRKALISKKIVIHQQNGFLFLDPDEIIFIEKSNKKVIFHTKTGSYITCGTLNDFEADLPKYFYRSHRSFIINIKQIKEILPSGRSYMVCFKGVNKKAYLSYERQKELLGILN